MSLDALSYSSQGKTGRFGQFDALTLSTWGKISKVTVFIIGLPLGITLEVDSEVVRVMSIDGITCRDFLIVASTDKANSFFAKEMTSEIIRNLDWKTQVIREMDIESIVEIDDEE